MSQEKYAEYYVELLTSTLNDQVLQNISLKAREKVNSEIFEEVSKGYQTILTENQSLKSDKEKSLSEKEVAKNAEIESLKKQLSDLQSSKNTEVERLKQQVSLLQTSKNTEIDDVKKRNSEQLQQVQSSKLIEIEQLNKIINGLRDEVAKAGLIHEEYDKLKHQINHVDTFRNELLKSRKENEDIKSEYEKVITELNDKIEYLQLPPSKKKKIDMLNKPKESLIEVFTADEFTKDGGSF